MGAFLFMLSYSLTAESAHFREFSYKWANLPCMFLESGFRVCYPFSTTKNPLIFAREKGHNTIYAWITINGKAVITDITFEIITLTLQMKAAKAYAVMVGVDATEIINTCLLTSLQF